MAANFNCIVCGVLVIVVGGLSSLPEGDDDTKPVAFCPSRCVCHGAEDSHHVNCSHLNLSSVPDSLGALTDTLDLSGNEISQLPEYAFDATIYLTEIMLDGNQLTSLPATAFTGLIQLHKLHLADNKFLSIPGAAFKDLQWLHKLWLSRNEIAHVDNDTFVGMDSLLDLSMDSNHLTHIPVKAFANLTSLRALTLASNMLEEVPDYAFSAMANLIVLLLSNNAIKRISPHAFAIISKLRILELDRNDLTELPTVISTMHNLEELSISDNHVKYLPEDCFRNNKKLTILQLKNNRILSVEKNTFANLPRLKNLILSEMHHQREFPNLTGTVSLELLTLDRGGLRYVPYDLCHTLPKLKSLDVHSNEIAEIPNLSDCKQLRVLILGRNRLLTLPRKPFDGLTMLLDLIIPDNFLEELHEHTFVGLPDLQYLDLKHNRISAIHPDAFVPLKSLVNLNLGENYFTTLPTRGLEKLRTINTFKTLTLKDFPPPEALPNIRILTLSYAYHCCSFISKKDEMKDSVVSEIHEDITWLNSYDDSMFRNFTSIVDLAANLSGNYDDFASEILQGYGTLFELEYPDSDLQSSQQQAASSAHHHVTCKPMPGPFLPCTDLMGWWSLRAGIWVIFLLALLGNGSVLFINMFSHSKMDVPKFLICNLASADLMMGVYLGFLAIVDASTLGEFKKHAIWWQLSSGCQLAGFLALLSSELSVFTLSVITLERHYAIMHAMYLNKRLSLKQAGYIMTCGWCFCLLLASLPLFGISDYRMFAVCLPFKTEGSLSLGFVCFLMLLNGVTFLIIVCCYTKIYCSIRNSHAWSSNDSRIAKRMALLVFTDFICWAPICFFSLTAAFGHELITLNEAKVFTIFVLPLNSCANPFLYAIFTKQFKTDCRRFCRCVNNTIASGRNLSRGTSNHRNMQTETSRILISLQGFFRFEKRNVAAAIVNVGNAAGDGALPLNPPDVPIAHRGDHQMVLPNGYDGGRRDVNSEMNRDRRNVQFCEIMSDSKDDSSDNQCPLIVGDELLPKCIILHPNGTSSAAEQETNIDGVSVVSSRHNSDASKKPWRFPWLTSTVNKSLNYSQSQTSSPVTMKRTPFHSTSLNCLDKSATDTPVCPKETVQEKTSWSNLYRKQSTFSDTDVSTDVLELCDCSDDNCFHDGLGPPALPVDLCCDSGDDGGKDCTVCDTVGEDTIAESRSTCKRCTDSCVVSEVDVSVQDGLISSDPTGIRSVQDDSEPSNCDCDSITTVQETTQINDNPCTDDIAQMSQLNDPVTLPLNGGTCQHLPLLRWHRQNGNARCIANDVEFDHCTE